MSVGGPESRALRRFGDRIYEAFGHMVYQVGSSVNGKEWRDVDLVLMLPDKDFEALFGTVAQPFESAPVWALLCDALSALGEKETGLPIDFKVQPTDWANRVHAGGKRNALFKLPFEPVGAVEAKLSALAIRTAFEDAQTEDGGSTT